ncbi:carbohydrate kinase family protein [Telluria beijingensis]|uniref:carbohydrate kinase family protein n=1 Tax=Telluria beijingensis TaxID=3068633 RepID=UPI00279625EE|nr:carbohydrate kinase [Massilia sp. REN29]
MNAPLPQFVSAGEALTDLIRTAPDEWSSRTGGAGLNVARAMAALGVPSAFAGSVSTDVFGQALQASAIEAGLDARFLQTHGAPPLLAVVHQSNPPDYFFIGSDSADLRFDPAALPSGWERAARWVHFGGISLARQPLAGRLLALARSLKEGGCRISYDPNFRKPMDSGYDPMLAAMASLADVVKVSDDDLLALFRTDDLATALARLRALNPAATILFTRGAQGAELHAGGQAWRAAAPAIVVADTIGAGDASIGALLFSMMQQPGADGADHLRHAVAAGAAACTRAGASPPSRAEVADLAHRIAVTTI